MPVNHVAEMVFGTIGAICWTFQLVPQIWKSWREHSTHGLSQWLVLIWGFSGPFFGTYTVVQNLNIPLIIQPHLFTFLAFISWGQCLHYGKGRSKLSATIFALTAIIIAGAVEVGMVYAIRHSNIGILLVGIASSIILAIGFIPQYWVIYKCGEVVGISYLFMLIDMSGGIFSDLSLVFKGQTDVFAALAYTVVVVMDGSILILALLLNTRAAQRRKQKAGDEGLEENKYARSGDSSHVSSEDKSKVKTETEPI